MKSGNIATNWHSPPADLTLLPGQVHVWFACLDSGRELESYKKILSSPERARAERFHFPKDRDLFIFTHRNLRFLLGQYLGIAPEEICFSTTGLGKPFMGHQPPGREIRFNLSHSAKMVVYAFALNCSLGIDIEHIRPFATMEELARFHFSPQETAALLSVPPENRPSLFCHYWTRKEAWLKATGKGLSISLNEIDVSLISLPSTTLTPMSGNAEGWSLLDFIPATESVAALVVESPAMQIEFMGLSIYL